MDGKWTDSDKIEIAKSLAVMAIIQKNYGRELDVKNTIKAWEFVLQDYTAKQVSEAMRAYMRQSSDIPSPADLIKILNPPEKQITYAEYKHALEQHAAEGYPMFGYFGGVIKDYQKQQAAESGIKTRQEISDGRQPDELSQKVKAILAVTYGGQNGQS